MEITNFLSKYAMHLTKFWQQQNYQRIMNYCFPLKQSECVFKSLNFCYNLYNYKITIVITDAVLCPLTKYLTN